MLFSLQYTAFTYSMLSEYRICENVWKMLQKCILLEKKVRLLLTCQHVCSHSYIFQLFFCSHNECEGKNQNSREHSLKPKRNQKALISTTFFICFFFFVRQKSSLSSKKMFIKNSILSNQRMVSSKIKKCIFNQK